MAARAMAKRDSSALTPMWGAERKLGIRRSLSSVAGSMANTSKHAGRSLPLSRGARRHLVHDIAAAGVDEHAIRTQCGAGLLVVEILFLTHVQHRMYCLRSIASRPLT